MPDGTRVSLGTRTSFSYDSRYGQSERVVQLEGEAYFEVAKDKDKPFIVNTKEQSIKALGTKFNVSAYPTDSLLTTTLLEGSVLLTTQSLLHPTVLRPNEQFVYNKKRNQPSCNKSTPTGSFRGQPDIIISPNKVLMLFCTG